MYKQYSINTVSTSIYSGVYNAAKDSLKLWAKNRLQTYLQQTNRTWMLDSLICFNKNGTKCVMSILVQEGREVSNAVNFFYGMKIKEKWYFFRGATMYTTPYSHDEVQGFSKLHEIAMKEVFSGYLKKKDKGLSNLFGKTEWEINDRFFAHLGKIIQEGRMTDSLYDSEILNRPKRI